MEVAFYFFWFGAESHYTLCPVMYHYFYRLASTFKPLLVIFLVISILIKFFFSKKLSTSRCKVLRLKPVTALSIVKVQSPLSFKMFNTSISELLKPFFSMFTKLQRSSQELGSKKLWLFLLQYRRISFALRTALRALPRTLSEMVSRTSSRNSTQEVATLIICAISALLYGLKSMIVNLSLRGANTFS